MVKSLESFETANYVVDDLDFVLQDIVAVTAPDCHVSAFIISPRVDGHYRICRAKAAKYWRDEAS